MSESGHRGWCLSGFPDYSQEICYTAKIVKIFSWVSCCFAFACVLVFTFSSAAQTTPKPVAGASQYDGEPVVVEQYISIYRMAADGTGTHEISLRARLQTAAAIKDYGVVSVQYAGNSEHVEFDYVRVRRPDGTVAETTTDDAIEMPLPVTQAAPFYSDLKQKQLPVRSLRPGDTLEWKARVVRTKAEAPGQFWGQDSFIADVVVRSQVVELHVPAAVHLTVSSPTLQPVESSDETGHVYRWEHAQLKPTVGPEADAAKELKKKTVWTHAQELDWREGKLPDIAWSTFASWAAVGDWYRTLEAGRTQPDETIRAKVAELTRGKTTDEAKAQAVYQYVDSQVRYIGVAFGVGRYQPHQAAQVLENQYGDCKDKHTLLAAMLQALGLKPQAVLIGYAIRFNEAVPSPGSFNHAITQVQLDGKTVWLDSTAEGSPFRLLNPLLRNRPALVVPETGVATIERTPEALPFPDFQTFTADGTLDAQGVSNSRIVLTVRGDLEVEMRQAFDQASPAQYGEMAQGLANGMGYSGTTSKPEISGREDTAQPLKVAFDYKRDRAGDWANLRIIPQLAPNSLPRPDLKQPPVFDIELGTPRVETSSSAMKLPAGWTATLPDPIHQKCAWATFDQTYRREGGSVFATRRIEVLAPRVPQAEWKQYSTFAEAADLGNDNYIILERARGEKAAAVEASPDASAAELLRDAATSIQQKDFATAEKLLTRTQALDANLMGVWSAWGYVHAEQEKWPEAIADLRRELTQHPDAVHVYPLLVYAEQKSGESKDAEATLKAWSAAEPDDPAPATRMVAAMAADGNPAAAVAAGHEAEKRLPADKRGDPAFQVALGKAEVLAPGEKEAGRTRLVAVLTPSATPETLNDASYVLADASLELPLAESSTRKALDSMEADAHGWTLATYSADNKAAVTLESATWDTMGWVLFREGKPAEALLWIKPAWTNRQSAEEGEHLGDVYNALEQGPSALAAYRLADTLAAAGTDTVAKARLDEKVTALEKAGVKVSGEMGQTGLGHPIPLGKAHGADGSAEYKLLMRAGKVVEISAAGAKKVNGGDARLKEMPAQDFFPPSSGATLVRSVILNCYNGTCTAYLIE